MRYRPLSTQNSHIAATNEAKYAAGSFFLLPYHPESSGIYRFWGSISVESAHLTACGQAWDCSFLKNAIKQFTFAAALDTILLTEVERIKMEG